MIMPERRRVWLLMAVILTALPSTSMRVESEANPTRPTTTKRRATGLGREPDKWALDYSESEDESLDVTCSLFGRGEGGHGAPPAVVIGGFGGSSTRLVAALLSGACRLAGCRFEL